MSKIKAGIIGTGRATSISVGHLKGYLEHPDVELVGVYDNNSKAAEEWCTANGLDTGLCCASAEELIEKADVVSICTPNFAHTGYVKKCLEADTNVICEKPLSTTTEDWNILQEALKTTKASAMMDFNYRYIPGLQMVRDAVQNGNVGRIYTIRHIMGAPRLANESIPMEWRFVRKFSGAGALVDFGSHALDIMRYITDSDDLALSGIDAKVKTFITRRKGRDGTMQDVENDDTAMILADLKDGGLYNLTLSRVGTGCNLLEVVAEKAIITFDLMQPLQMTIQTRTENGPYGPKEIRVAANADEWKNCGVAVPYKACCEAVKDFVQRIEEGRKPVTDLHYGYLVLKDIEDIEKAAH